MDVPDIRMTALQLIDPQRRQDELRSKSDTFTHTRKHTHTHTHTHTQRFQDKLRNFSSGFLSVYRRTCSHVHPRPQPHHSLTIASATTNRTEHSLTSIAYIRTSAHVQTLCKISWQATPRAQSTVSNS